MSAAATILSELRSRGVRLELNGGRLLWRAPSELPPELLEAARLRRDELLDLLRNERAEPSLALGDSDLAETRERLGAVLIRSPRFGEVWLAIDPCIAPELEAEEAGRDEPRPVLLAEDVGRLQGQSDRAIAARLDVLRTFPGARVLS